MQKDKTWGVMNLVFRPLDLPDFENLADLNARESIICKYNLEVFSVLGQPALHSILYFACKIYLCLIRPPPSKNNIKATACRLPSDFLVTLDKFHRLKGT